MWRAWLSILVTLLTGAGAFAQRYPILPVSNSPKGIVTMMQDRRSVLWLGTDSDLFCFDGTNFYSLRAYGFPSERVSSLAEDDNGGIWIATQKFEGKEPETGGGIYRYQNGKVDKIASGNFSSIVRAGPDTLLAASYDEHVANFGQGASYQDLYLLRKSQETWHAFKVSDRVALYLSVDHHGAVLFPCPGGWCELTREQLLTWPKRALHPLFFPVPGTNGVTRVLRDRFDCVWFRGEEAADYACAHQSRKTLPDTVVSADSSQYLGELDDGNVLLLGNNLAFGRPGAMHTADRSKGLPGGIKSALTARDGTIFLGTPEGLYRFMYPFRLESWNQDHGVQSPYAILHDRDGVFASNPGIQKLDPTRANWLPWAKPEDVGMAVHLLPGPDHTIYTAALIRGAIQLSPAGKVLSQTPVGLGGARLASDGNGHTWLAGTGITVLKGKGSQLERSSAGLDSGTALDMEYDRQNKALWACHEREVVVLDKDHWTHIAQKDGLLNDYCRSIAVTGNGDVWVAYSNLSDVSRIRRESSGNIRVESFSTDPRPDNAENTFLDSDSRGWLWRASNHADYVAVPDRAAHGAWLRLDSQDGIPVPGGNQNSFFGDGDGSIWFANDNTIVHFDPPANFATRFAPPMAFIGGATVGSRLPVPWNALESLPHAESLVINVGCLQFDRRNAIHLRYRLLPAQSGWKETDSFKLPMGKLRGGRYTIELQSRLLDGDWSQIQTDSFTVLWPFWLTWPAFLIAGAGGTGVGLGAFQWRKHQRFRRELTLPDLTSWRNKALSPETANLIGTVVNGRYEISHILSIGGFATVVRARDMKQGGMLCAVKLFRLEIGNQAWIRHRFEQEVEALEKLKHPNIVRITGHGTLAEGAPYLVMEFIHGQNLRDRLEEGALPPRLIANFLRQLANALETLHKSLIFHRDLKPENLMVRSDENNEPQIVIIDFSIAIVKSPDQTFQGISRVAGTLEYMAPEQVIGYADATTDIYSLAKVFMEMLTGSLWADLLPEATLDLPKQVRSYLMKYRNLLTEESAEMIASALAFDPQQRPGSVSAFAKPLIRDLEGAF